MQKIRLYSSNTLFALFLVLSVALCVFIFCMSNEPAAASSDRSGTLADIFAPILVKNFGELDEGKKAQTLSDVDHLIRKIAHFCMYATLGALFVLVSLRYKRTWSMHLLMAWLFGTVYAASDEIHQAFVPGRGPLITDVLLDSIGVLCGIVFILAITRFFPVSRKVDNNE